jgi:acyl-CoA synthetase (AMP-forming)/AMP-acid ligase II
MDLLHSTTLGDVSRENARRFPQRMAAVCDNHRLGFPDIDARSNQVASALSLAGVAEGERVLWLGQSSYRVLELLIACSKIGAILCPANWRLSPPELAFVIDDCNPRLIIAQDREVGTAIGAARSLCALKCRWIYHDRDGHESYESFVACDTDKDTDIPISDELPLLMIYTAAFGGRPNGAMLSSRALISTALSNNFVERLSHEDIFLVSGPLFHIGCWRYVLGIFLLGGTNVFARRVEAETLARLIAAEKCTHAYLFAATQTEVAIAATRNAYDLTSLRWVVGDRAWNALISPGTNPWIERPQRYGQTEVGGIVARGAYGPDPVGQHGRSDPLAQLRIIDDHGSECPIGQIGEIVVRGPVVMNEYRNRPALNAERRVGVWQRTNDLGRREIDGSITFVGPKFRMLKSGLENIYPEEVEAAVREHPQVLECAVIGVPDEKFIQAIKVIVVPRVGCAPTLEDLIAHSRARLAGYKVPRSLVLVEQLPRREGVVDYNELDAAYGGGAYPGGNTRTNNSRDVYGR